MIQSSGRTLAFKAMPAGSEGKAQGLMAMSHQFGFFIGPPIGGLIIDLIHWRGIFFVLFLPSLAGAALCMITGRAATVEPARQQTIDYRGGLLLFALTVLATLLLDQKVAQMFGGGSQLCLGALFLAALWYFLRHEKRVTSPLVDLSIFSVRVFGYGSVGLLFCNINQGLATFITPFYLQEVLKLSPTFIGTIFLVPSLLSMVLSPVSGALTDRIGSRVLLIVGVLVLMASFIIGVYLRSDSHWLLPTILLALTGIGSAFFNTASQAAMIRALPKENLGHGDRHYQRCLRFGPYARYFLERDFFDYGVSLLHRRRRRHARPGEQHVVRCGDESDLPLCLGARRHSVVYLDQA